MALTRLSSNQGATVRKRWTGLATTLALVSSVLVLNGTIGAKANHAPGESWTLFAAGDIAKCDGGADELTAALIKNGITDRDHSRVLMLGDGAYKDGSLQTYMDCYDKTQAGNDGWGQFKDITLPVPGNHDYGQKLTPSNGGYRQYWDPVLQKVDKSNGGTGEVLTDQSGWYSVDVGNWHIIALNWACSNGPNTEGGSMSGCDADDPQGRWLQDDLAKATAANKHILAMWHGARFFSKNDDGPTATDDSVGPSTDYSKTNDYWRMLHAAGADLVLAGHHHNYERFAHMSVEQPPVGPAQPAGDHQGQVDPSGPRQFVVGTGGGELFKFMGDPAVGSEFRTDAHNGVLKLVLHENSYEWAFLAPGAAQPLDQGSDTTLKTIAGTGTTGTTGTTGPSGGGVTTTTTNGQINPPTNRQGYWMVGADGKVFNFGTAQKFGDAGLTPGTQAVDLEPTPSGDGYWVVDDAGGVAARGDAVYRGGPDSLTLKADEKVTSLSSTATGRGYWMFTNKGRVLAFGDATHIGDMSGKPLNAPVLDSIVTPSGKGYYMVAADGGIFAFGDAVFRGSMGDKKLNKPVQSLVPDSDGVGYWLVASDGGIFAFEAPFKGSMGDKKLNKPVTGMVRYADGYLMVGEDGGIFNFSSQGFLGSLGNNPPARPIVSVAALG
jgi:Calcineurin-like phosphoesterase